MNKRYITYLPFIYFFIISGAIVFIFPVLYMLVNSFMEPKEIEQGYSMIRSLASNSIEKERYASIRLIPQKVTFIQYYNLFLRKPSFLMMFWNSIRITVPIVIGQTVIAVFAAFGFSKIRFPFREKIFFVYIIVMMLPFQVTLVANYIVLDKLNFLGSYVAIILPGIFTTFGVFLLRQFMKNIPYEYMEAAKMDGAGYFSILIKIIIPQCKAGIASLAILIFIDNWNMVEQPLVFLRNENMHPLSVFLTRINEGNMDVAFACGVIYMLPAVLVFLYNENYFIEGIQLSGIK